MSCLEVAYTRVSVIKVSTPTINGVPVHRGADVWSVDAVEHEGHFMIALDKGDRNLVKWCTGTRARYDGKVSAVVDFIKNQCILRSVAALDSESAIGGSRRRKKATMRALQALQAAETATTVSIELPAFKWEGNEVGAISVVAMLDVQPTHPVVEVSDELLKWLYFKVAASIVEKRKAARPPLEKGTTWHAGRRKYVRRDPDAESGARFKAIRVDQSSESESEAAAAAPDLLVQESMDGDQLDSPDASAEEQSDPEPNADEQLDSEADAAEQSDHSPDADQHINSHAHVEEQADKHNWNGEL